MEWAVWGLFTNCTIHCPERSRYYCMWVWLICRCNRKTGSYEGSIIKSLSLSILNLSTPGMYILTSYICCDCSFVQIETSFYHWLPTSTHMLSSCVSIWYSRDLQPTNSILYIASDYLKMNSLIVRVSWVCLLPTDWTVHSPYRLKLTPYCMRKQNSTIRRIVFIILLFGGIIH